MKQVLKKRGGEGMTGYHRQKKKRFPPPSPPRQKKGTLQEVIKFKDSLQFFKKSICFFK